MSVKLSSVVSKTRSSGSVPFHSAWLSMVYSSLPMALSSSVIWSFKVAALPCFSSEYLRMTGPVLSMTTGSLMRLPVRRVATVLLLSSLATTRTS